MSDAAAIADLTREAFAASDYGDNGEAAIISALRATGALSLSLVAMDGEQLLGHVAFSPVDIAGVDGGWFGLGPVSTHPARQGEGIGSALIRAGLEMLRKRGAHGCVVLGEPGYYQRFGFEQQEGLRYPGAPPEYFLGLSFTASKLPSGVVSYHRAFGGS